MKKILWRICLIVAICVVAAGSYYILSHKGASSMTDSPEATTIYSDTVSGADDCTSYETYDAEKKTCYYSCTTQGECDAIQAKIDDMLDTWDSDYGKFSSQINDTAKDTEGGAQNELASYQEEPGEQLKLVSGTDSPKYQDDWQRFAAISPDDFTDKRVSGMTIYSAPSDNTIAYVSDEDGDGRWRLYVNDAVFGEDAPKEQFFTLIHEFSHIVTLNTDQVDPTISQVDCPRYYPGEGCADANSYIEKFVEDFWSPSMIAEADKVSQDDVSPLYNEAPDRYLTEYAATNPPEDIAESFAIFVMQPEQAAGAGVAAQKAAFFKEYPELVTLRSQIREALSRYAIKTEG